MTELGAVLTRLQGWGELPPVVAYLVVPVLVTVCLALGASLGPAQVRHRRARMAALLLLLGMGLQLVTALRPLLPVWGWALIALSLPFVAVLSGRWAPAVILLWLMVVLMAVAAVLDLLLNMQALGGLLYASGGVMLMVVLVMRWREPPAPPAPPPAPPARSLIDHLDSPAAQEGADKYTRE